MKKAAHNARERPYQRREMNINKEKRGKQAAQQQTSTLTSRIDEAEKQETIEDERRAGGLRKQLRLAIGGRIMLRRNLRPGLGLVNGTRGVLVGVERDEVDTNRVARLLIEFDNVADVQKIERVSAAYTVGVGLMRTRSQFPVVMAFAATIHKCQGMTLENAIISTGAIFAPCKLELARKILLFLYVYISRPGICGA
jgi:ATP-dependent exoDNAse (exonuclease V) alpha subunit